MKKQNVHMNLFLKSDVLIIESKIVKNNFFSSFFGWYCFSLSKNK